MDSIGAKLKQARESKGLSMEQAQKETRIHHRILLALENNKPEQAVSGIIYIKSFIKKYANYLGLNGVLLAEEYQGENRKLPQKFSVEKRQPSDFNFPVKGFFTVVIILLTIFLAASLLIFSGSKVRAFLKSRPKIEKKLEPPKKLKKTDKLESENSKRAQISKQTPQAITSRPVKAAVFATSPVSSNEDINLSIKTRGDTYLKIKLDGALVYDDMLKKGSAEAWKAKQSFEVSAGRAEFIDAELNGKTLPSFGKGVVKEILITRSGLKLPN
ncbi:MAG: RodZ domain-containing protein [Candidatus Omnitrophota bacterium]